MSRYQFDFEAHGRSLELCERIVDRLVSLFGVPLEEAVGRVNKHWQGRVFEDLDIICHEDEDFWANNIYFGTLGVRRSGGLVRLESIRSHIRSCSAQARK